MYSFSIELSDGHRVSVSNDGHMSTISNELVKPGQRASSKSSFNTGALVGSPKYIKTSDGLLIVLETESGQKQVKVAGGSMTTGSFTFDDTGLSEMSES